jgi:hypothetical protein
MKPFLFIGLVGFGVALAVNLIAMLAFSKPEAAFFSEAWYSSWLPNYAVWLVFAIIGLGQTLFPGKPSEKKDES